MHDPRKLITVFLPSFHGGGAERVMILLANEFSLYGFRVDIVVASASGRYSSYISSRVRVVSLNQERVIKCVIPMVEYLKFEKPAVLLSAIRHANIIATLAAIISRSGCQVIVTEHSSALQASRSFRARVVHWISKLFYPLADKVVCVSEGIRRDLQRTHRLRSDHLKTIFNPHDLQMVLRESQKSSSHHWFEQSTVKVILAVGRLTPAKDYSTLLRAFSILRMRRELRLIILGEGEEHQMLRELAIDLKVSEHVDFVGFVENPFSFMARCDVFVLSSKWEGLPGVLIEAMACGAKIVSTDCVTGPHEILEGGRWGRLVKVGDIEGLANAISSALDDSNPPDVKKRAAAFQRDAAVMAYLREFFGAATFERESENDN